MKSPTEKTFPEFQSWATGHILFSIGEGKPLREAVGLVLNQALLNEVFGQKKPVKISEAPKSQDDAAIPNELKAACQSLLGELYDQRDKAAKKNDTYYFVKGKIRKSLVLTIRKLIGDKDGRTDGNVSESSGS